MRVPFNNLTHFSPEVRSEIHAAVERVLDSGWFILGPEVEKFEAAFAAYHQLPHSVSVANGTDAIEIALRAAGVGPGDEVITVAHTAVPTVCAIERTGATPVLVDVDPDTYTMDVAAAEAAVTLRTRAIVPVHLYGHPARIDRIRDLADRHMLFLLEDCAQAHGAKYQDRLVGTWGDAAAFSFYPTKNLGAYGDGGAVVTRDPALAERMKRIRNYGQTVRYYHQERGFNSRLDEIQAAILGVKLRHLDAHNDFRRLVSRWYAESLTDVATPKEVGPIHHVYHLYVARHPRRDWLRDQLKARGVDCQIHYPIPIHRQEAYRDLGYGPGSLPVTEHVASEILSLPLNLGLSESDVRFVGEAIREVSTHARAA
jgi:dTDP-3-amino-3,4,6-trideoxy-alpha-D-glucose transaminase